MSNSLPSINLVKNKEIPIFDKFLNWSLSAGRLIVILTEVVAVIAFIYRFSLDERLTDLHSSVKKKQIMVSALKSDENKYRNLQDRISLAGNFSAKGLKASQIITDITSLIPQQIKINNLSLNKDKIKLDIDAPFVSSLESLVGSLKNYPNASSISIDNIENKPSVGISASITTALK